ncbi:MAG: 3-dehydroquinate synthase family protein [Clostridia bacterium]
MHRISFINSEGDILKELNQLIIKNNLKKAYILTDKNVYDIYHRQIKHFTDSLCVKNIIKIVDPGELSKSLETVETIVEELVLNFFQRDSLIINLGGGVITDLGGFIASNYLRGIQYVNIPTTIIGQVDASIGGKTAINMFGIKNNFGSFYKPLKVLIYDAFIKSLDEVEKANGYGEIVKYSVLTGDKKLLKQDYTSIVKKCIDYKLNLVKKDLYDNNKRKYLNLGHTLGHGLETMSSLPHGISVYYGIIFANFLAQSINLSNSSFQKEFIKETEETIEFKKYLKGANIYNIDIDSLVNVISHDKKVKNNQIEWILPIGWGKILCKEVERDRWIKALIDFIGSGFF